MFFASAIFLGAAHYAAYSCHQTSGTVTQIGAAEVTALHLTDGCKTAQDFPPLDISILKHGETGECRNATIGENVFLAGYPDGPEDEVRRGVVVLEDVTLKVQNRANRKVDRVGISVMMAPDVRPGYSGGPAISVDDGRVVGIILGVGPVRTDGFRAVIVQPVETICNSIVATKKAP